MRKSGFGSVPRPGVLKPRNDITPRQSCSGSTRKSHIPKLPHYEGGRLKRLSSDCGGGRPSTSSNRYTPTRNNTLMPNAPSTSMSAEKRSSSVGSINRKEMRPISDPSFKSRCVDKIMDFLLSNQYEYPIQRRTLLTPTSKDFSNIFQFIYRNMDSSYILPAKFEEEIPRLLKLLRYPVQISKSSFITVGSPHTWPTVLAMLDWLVDVVNVKLSDPLSIAFPLAYDAEVNESRLRFDFACKVYQCDTEDEVEEYYENYRQTLEKGFKVRPQDMQKQQEELEMLENEELDLDNQQEKVDELKHLHKQVVHDHETLIQYCKDLQSYIATKKSEFDNAQQTLCETERKEQQINDEICRLEQLKAEQCFSATELAHFKNHANEMAELGQQFQQQCKELDSKTWEQEMNISKTRSRLTETANLYNTLVSQLDLGADFEVDINSGDNSAKWQNTLIPLLRMKKKDAKHHLFEMQTLVRQKENEIYMAKEMLQEDITTKSKLESKLQRLEEDFIISKNEIEAEKKEMLQENERLLEQIKEGRKASKASLQQKQRVVDQKREELENKKEEVKERAKKGAEFLAKVCSAALDHLDFIKKECAQYKVSMDQVCSDVKKVLEGNNEENNSQMNANNISSSSSQGTSLE